MVYTDASPPSTRPANSNGAGGCQALSELQPSSMASNDTGKGPASTADRGTTHVSPEGVSSDPTNR